MDIRVSTLPNGLRIVTDYMPQVETASLGVWVDVGARYETPENNGVTHLLEHMLFKGTKKRTAFEISHQIESVGGHMNAYTSREETAYYAQVLKEDVPLAIDIIGDILQNSLLDENELAKERPVVLQEIGRTQDNPAKIIHDYFYEAAFPGQSLGRTVLGPAEIVGKMPRATLADYVQRHYNASRMILVVSGNINPDQVLEIATKVFSDLPRGNSIPMPKAEYKGGEKRIEKDSEQIHLVLGFPGLHHLDPQYYTLQILSVILGGGMSSRLFQEVREKRGLVYSISSYISAFKDTGFMGIYAGTGPEHIDKLIPVVCDEVVKIGRDVTEEELTRAKTQLRSSLLMGLENTMDRCSQLADNMLVYGRPLSPQEILTRLNAVTLSDVKKAAVGLHKQPPTLAALGPIQGLEDYTSIQKRLAN